MLEKILLISQLTPNQLHFWRQANHNIVWGWKRDVGREKRLVYFTGHLALDNDSVYLDRYYFYYRTVLDGASSCRLQADVEAAETRFRQLGAPTSLKTSRKEQLDVIEFSFGQATAIDLDRTRRLKLRRPRSRILQPDFPVEQSLVARDDIFPADLYIGSGVSYEAGLPTLCDMHDAFAVDGHQSNGFMVGASDWLPGALAGEGFDRLRQFCAVHTGAILAEPTDAMKMIGTLVRTGRIRKIFTDNIDRLMSKVGVDFEFVRGSGVFNERYDTKFASPNLLVVGVAADRRQIVRQARAQQCRIVVVNPCRKVSPNVTHLEYLTGQDVFYKTTANEFFSAIVPAPAMVAL